MAQVLLEFDADSDQTRIQTGASPEWIAFANGHFRIAQLLQRSGANATADSSWKSPMEIAQDRCHWRIVDLWHRWLA